MNDTDNFANDYVIVSKEEYKSLMRASVLADFTRRFLCDSDSDYRNLSMLKFAYNIPKEDE